jgi:hypothetical protein
MAAYFNVMRPAPPTLVVRNPDLIKRRIATQCNPIPGGFWVRRKCKSRTAYRKIFPYPTGCFAPDGLPDAGQNTTHCKMFSFRHFYIRFSVISDKGLYPDTPKEIALACFNPAVHP